MDKRTHAGQSVNFRKNPGGTILVALPIGHLVDVEPAVNGWHPASTAYAGRPYAGFIHSSVVRDPISPEVDAIVELAGAEFVKWANGHLNELSPEGIAYVERYWRKGAGYLPENLRKDPWSAAFVSYVIRTVSLPKSFKFAGRHTTYLADSKKAFNNGDGSRAYHCVPLGANPLRIGDMVAAYRTGTGCGSRVRTYADIGQDFCSHCDIVVAIVGDEAITVGGNVRNSVSITKVALDPSGRVQAIKQRIAVMRHTF
jgi:hypothetical protein